MSNSARHADNQVIADVLKGFTGSQRQSDRERRRFTRRAIRTRVDFVPLLANGPRFDAALQAETQNISADGVAIILADAPLSPKWGVLLNLGDRKLLLEVNVRQIQKGADGRFLLSCQFVRRIGLAEASAP